MIPKELQNMRPMTGKERLGANRESEYLGAEDIEPGTEPVLTIKAIYNGMITLARGKERHDVISFVEEKVPGSINQVRPLVVNATNRKTLRKLFKAVTAETLMGKKIRLYLEHNVRDPSTGDKVDGIRIRPSIPDGATQAAAPVCEACGNVISGMTGFTAEQIAATNRQRYGKMLCIECGKKRKAEIDAEQAAKKAAEQADAVADSTQESVAAEKPKKEPTLAERLAAEMEE